MLITINKNVDNVDKSVDNLLNKDLFVYIYVEKQKPADNYPLVSCSDSHSFIKWSNFEVRVVLSSFIFCTFS